MNVSHFPSGCCGSYKHTIRVLVPSGAVVSITGAGSNPESAKVMAENEFNSLFKVENA